MFEIFTHTLYILVYSLLYICLATSTTGYTYIYIPLYFDIKFLFIHFLKPSIKAGVQRYKKDNQRVRMRNAVSGKVMILNIFKYLIVRTNVKLAII